MAKIPQDSAKDSMAPRGSESDEDKKAAYDAEGQDLQRKIDQKDHAIAELLVSNPAITNIEIGNLLGMKRNAIAHRRKREVFIRYMLWLRRPAIEELQQATKHAIRRIREALDAIQGRGKLKRPDHWVRITAARMATDIVWGRRYRHEMGKGSQRGNVPGVNPEDLPDLGQALLSGFRSRPKKKARRRRTARKRKGGRK